MQTDLNEEIFLVRHVIKLLHHGHVVRLAVCPCICTVEGTVHADFLYDMRQGMPFRIIEVPFFVLRSSVWPEFFLGYVHPL